MSFLWYDLETFGRDPRRSRIAQFAAVRTDEDLRETDEAISLFCQPANDVLPSPVATLITGIIPQHAAAEGFREAEFMAVVHEAMAQPGTCSAGYNSLRFDDEFIRFGLYRNFHEPYAREWQNGNSRWDLLDVLRAVHALRPDALVWPKREDGFTSFKLEDLAMANGVREGMAHEALSDVRALIALARKLRSAQARTWDYLLAMRSKQHAAVHCDMVGHSPVFHISGRFPAAQRHAALVGPLGLHPRFSNRIVAFDLGVDPARFEALDDAGLHARLYTPRAALPEGEQRLPLKAIHTNRCPVLLPLAHVRPSELESLGLDRARAEAHAAWLRAHPDFVARCLALFAEEPEWGATDADGDLYRGFLSKADARWLPKVRTAAPADLPALTEHFQDERMRTLLFRYQARNWPESLDASQRKAWDHWRHERFSATEGGEGNLAAYVAERATAGAMADTDAARQRLAALDAWVSERLAEVGLDLAP